MRTVTDSPVHAGSSSVRLPVISRFNQLDLQRLSSTEAEYIAGALSSNKTIWLCRLLSELDQTQSDPTSLNTDNQASISLARNPVFHKATKHIEVRHHHMRHCFESGIIMPIYVPTEEQVADVLTKPLLKEKHEMFAKEMGLVWD